MLGCTAILPAMLFEFVTTAPLEPEGVAVPADVLPPLTVPNVLALPDELSCPPVFVLPDVATPEVTAPFTFLGSGTPLEFASGLEPAGRILSCGMTPTLFFLAASVLVSALRLALEIPVCSVPSWVAPFTPPFEPVCTWGLCEGHTGICNLTPSPTHTL